LSKKFKPRDLKIGQTLELSLKRLKITKPGKSGSKRATYTISRLSIDTDIENTALIEQRPDGAYTAKINRRKLVTLDARREGTIDSSLYLAGRRAQVPSPILAKLIQIFSFDIDFQRDIQSGDSFDIVFERLTTETGDKVRDGAIVYAELRLGSAIHKFYRFVDEHGQSGYFDKNGQGARKPLLRTPVDGARLTSRYARRRHPVLRYTRMHRGVDFAAPRGTPVYAAGNGRIVFRGRKGAFGKYIKIRHNSHYQTAYAHLRSFRRGVTSGSRAKQGQIIGYVGSTGTATGPHLHFEVIFGGRQVNPLRVRLPSGRKLKGKQLVAFQAMRGALTQRMADLRTQGIKISSN